MDDDLDVRAAKPSRPFGPGLIAAIISVTLLGGGAGAGFAVLVVDSITAVAERRASEPPARDPDALAWDAATAITRLEPVIANLAAPRDMFVRLDAAMVFDRDAVGDVERMKATIAEDILAYLRTTTLSDVTGASAFNHLRDDLDDRVRIASDGAVEDLLIETMVLQ